MIATTTIDSVRNRMDVVEVLSQFIKLKQRGANYTGLCPFHNEKSPSFSVSSAKQIYKCFGCGKSGDAITFLREHEKLDYPAAIEWLANHYNITIEHDQHTTPESQETKDLRTKMFECIAIAQTKFEQALHSNSDAAVAVTQYLKDRFISEKKMREWSIGFAPLDFKFLTTTFINTGNYQAALDCGLIVTKEGNTHDFFINRITIPIRDLKGNIVGFGGRIVPSADPDADKKYAKYMNPKESIIYNKSKMLFGLYEAITAKAFNSIDGETPPVYICEGYFDVISMHESDIHNTVAGCGTAITAEQLKILRRYTSHAVLLLDSDSAGMKAAEKTIDLLLQQDFKAEIIELVDAKDVDECIGAWPYSKHEAPVASHSSTAEQD